MKKNDLKVIKLEISFWSFLILANMFGINSQRLIDVYDFIGFGFGIFYFLMAMLVCSALRSIGK